MLRELHVKNLAVLAGASVSFGPGFNVLSGETGAGKSIVVDSLALLAGARASADLIRSGAESLTVTGVFEAGGDGWRAVLEAAGVESEGDEILVRREIGRSGKNRVYVNDQPATLRLLADLAPFLLRIHGQRDELGLVAPDLQRAWLDRSGGEEAERLLAATARAFDEHERLAARLGRLSGDERARAERLDLLRFAAQEIDAARLVAGEDETLRAERDVLRNAEAIVRALGGAWALLSEDEGSAVERVAKSRSLLADVEEWEREAAAWGTELDELRIRLAEVAASLARRLDGLDADPARLDAVEERLALVERLARKYGGSTAAALERRREIEPELAELEGGEQDRAELEGKVATALEAYRKAALALSRAREVWGGALVRRIEKELADLGLGKARLGVRLERRRLGGSPLVVDGEPVDFGREGLDQVVFELAANPGEEPRPLAKVASGGESEAARPTLVFDEVDTGIGGAEAAALGGKLRRLARGGGQILAVTHLPQVASHADLHFKVSKRIEGGRTSVAVETLSEEARIEEVARMLAGAEVTRTSLSHAQELIAGAARLAP